MRRKKRLRRTLATYSILEPRKMLAGDINAFVDDGVLLVVGDAQANEVAITQNDAGAFVVTGVDTTINGGSQPFTTSSPFAHVTISLAGGNDEASLDGVVIGSGLSFFGGDGNDRFVTTDSLSRQLHANGGAGDDVFEVDLITRKSAYFYLGEGDDVVVASSLFAGRNFKVFGDDGNDTISTESLTVGRRIEIDVADGNDDVLFSGETSVRREARFELGDGDDFVAVLPEENSASANFGRIVSVDAGDGDDVVTFDPSVNATRSVSVRGGDGTDTFQSNGAQVSDDIRSSKIENAQVADLNLLVDEVMTRLNDVGIGDETDNETVDLEITTSSNVALFAENGNPIAPDGGITLVGSENVESAAVAIIGFEAGDEVLTFTDTSAITGSFNASTGRLSLTGVASTADYQQALRSVRFENTSDNPSTDIREFRFTVDTDQETVSANRDFRIDAVNDSPQLDFNTTSRTVLPDGLPIVLDALLTVSDEDSESLESAVVTIANGYVVGQDILRNTSFAGVASSFDETTGALTLSGDVNLSVWQDVLRSITFDNDADSPTTGTRTIRFTLDDGTSTSSSDFSLELEAEEVEPNRFEVSESIANGTIVGTITTENNLGSNVIYQRSDLGGSDSLRLSVDDHLSGDMAAPIVLIEYIDFQCPGCAAIHPVVNQLKQDFDGELLVVSRHLPLESIHGNARAAAIASEAAASQGMFDEMADLLFANQSEWENVSDPTSIFEGYATTLGLSLTEFRAEVANPESSLGVTRDATEAARLGLTGTPSFFLEEEQIANPGTLAAFTNEIQDAIDANDSPFQINRETGEIVVVDNSLLTNSANTTFVLPFIVEGANGVTENVQVTIRVV